MTIIQPDEFRNLLPHTRAGVMAGNGFDYACAILNVMNAYQDLYDLAEIRGAEIDRLKAELDSAVGENDKIIKVIESRFEYSDGQLSDSEVVKNAFVRIDAMALELSGLKAEQEAPRFYSLDGNPDPLEPHTCDGCGDMVYPERQEQLIRPANVRDGAHWQPGSEPAEGLDYE